MIDKIEKWIQGIQRDNWGFPWHIFFACVLFIMVFPVFHFHWHFNRGPFWPYLMAAITVNVVGILNEIFKPDQDKSEFWQDTAANNVGIIIGALLWIYILLIMG